MKLSYHDKLKLKNESCFKCKHYWDDLLYCKQWNIFLPKSCIYYHVYNDTKSVNDDNISSDMQITCKG